MCIRDRNGGVIHLKEIVQVKLVEKEFELTTLMSKLNKQNLSLEYKNDLLKNLKKVEQELKTLREYEDKFTRKKRIVFLDDDDFDQ